MKNIFFIPLFIIIAGSSLFAQDDVQIGSNFRDRTQTQGGLFDYSDPAGFNIKVQLWGYVKYPGYYVVPANSNLNDILSYAGGPVLDAMMDDIRIYRKTDAGNEELLKYNLDDLLWGDSLATQIVFPKLFAGDVILVPGEPRYFVREDIQFFVSISLALATLAVLIISLTD
jgi:hypothetical protein